MKSCTHIEDIDESAERALFARRAESPELALPPAIGLAIETRIANEQRPSRGWSGELAGRGYVSAACVAALVLLAAAFHRPTDAFSPVRAPAPAAAAGSLHAAEPLACTAPLSLSPSSDDRAACFIASEPLASLSPLASNEVLACGAQSGHDSVAICEPNVTR